MFGTNTQYWNIHPERGTQSQCQCSWDILAQVSLVYGRKKRSMEIGWVAADAFRERVTAGAEERQARQRLWRLAELLVELLRTVTAGQTPAAAAWEAVVRAVSGPALPVYGDQA